MSSNEVAARSPDQPAPARFTLWPLPELRLVAQTAADDGAPTASPEETAYERGVADGRLAATQESRADLDKLTGILRDVAQELRTVREGMARDVEEQIFVLAMAVARQVIHREVASDSTVVAEMVRAALDAVSWDASITVRLHPDDHAAVQQYFEDLDPEARPGAVAWEADSAMERGGYVVDTPARIVDGRLDHVLTTLHRHLVND